MSRAGEFARLLKEFGGQKQSEEQAAEEEEAIETMQQNATLAIDEAKTKADKKQRMGAGTGKLEGRLIIPERRATGEVSWRGAYHLGFSQVVAEHPVQSMASISRPGGAMSQSRFFSSSWS